LLQALHSRSAHSREGEKAKIYGCCSEGEDGLICRAPTLIADASHSGMSSLISCGELQQLKWDYDRSLRVWAHYAFPLPHEVLPFPGRLAQLKYDAQLERDIAAKRLSAHQGNCPICSLRRSSE
jgi:hypothetical protein